MNGWFSFVPYCQQESRADFCFFAKTDCFLSCFFVFIHSTKAACFLCRQFTFPIEWLFSFNHSIWFSFLLSWKIAILKSCFQVFKTVFFPSAFRYIFPSIHIAIFLKSGTNKHRKTTHFEMCPQMSPFVLICPITCYFTAFLIPVTLQPKGIGQANQAPAAGSVPISANSNPSVDGFLFALANSKVCSKQLEILSAALNALPGRSRDMGHSEVVTL